MKKILTKRYRFYAILLAVIMILSAIPFIAAAEEPETASSPADQIKYGGGILYYKASNGDEPVAAADNWDVSVSKTVAAGTVENEFEITLQVQTTQNIENVVITPEVAVVLSIDMSASMANGLNNNSASASNPSRLSYAKDSAAAFIENYANGSNGAARYLAIVTFSTQAGVVLGWVDVGTASGKQAALAAISNLSSSTFTGNNYDPSLVGSGTYMQGGLQLARNMYRSDILPGSLADWDDVTNRFVIMLTDGNPNTYNGSGAVPAETAIAATGSPYWNNSYTPDESATAFAASRPYARAIADQIKNGHTFSLGGDSYTTKSAKLYTIAFNTTNTAYGGTVSGSGNKNSADWLASEVASGTNYAKSAEDGIQLNEAFNAISRGIDTWANAYVVTDPMGAGIIFNSTIAYSDEPYLEYVGDTLTWRLIGYGNDGGKPSTVEAHGNKIVYTFSYTYKIILDTITTGAGIVPTNKATKLNYAIFTQEYIDEVPVGQPDIGESRIVDFKIPKVKGYAGELEFTKVSSNGETLAGFAFEIRSADGRYVDDTAVSDENGIVSFTGIPSGPQHSYTVTEIGNPKELLYTKGSPFAVSIAYGVAKYTLEGNKFVNNALPVEIPLCKFFECLEGTLKFIESETGETTKVLTLVCPDIEHTHNDDCYDLSKTICGLTTDDWDVEPADAVAGEKHVHGENCYDYDDNGDKLLDENDDPILICGLTEDDWDVEPADAVAGVKHTHSAGAGCYELICEIPEHGHTTDECYIETLSSSYTFYFDIFEGNSETPFQTLELTLPKDEVLSLIQSGDFAAAKWFKDGIDKFTIPASKINAGKFTIKERLPAGADYTGWELAVDFEFSLADSATTAPVANMTNTFGDLKRPYFTIAKDLSGDIGEVFTFVLYEGETEVDRFELSGGQRKLVRLTDYINANTVLTLKEAGGSTLGMKYDDKVYSIKITDGVVSDINGVVTTYAGFKNEYYAPEYDKFTIVKTTNGAGVFEFEITADGYIWDGIPYGPDGVPGNKADIDLTSVTHIDGNGSAEIDLKKIDEQALPNFTGTISVKEIPGGGTGNGTWVYDRTEYTFWFDNGRLTGKSVNGDEVETDRVAGFENTFTPTRYVEPQYGSLTINKVISGVTPPAGYDATFTVTGPSGYSNTVNYSSFTNGAYTIRGLNSGSYTVTETSSTAIEGYTWSVTGSGSVAAVTANRTTDVTVTNSYTPIVIDIPGTTPPTTEIEEETLVSDYSEITIVDDDVPLIQLPSQQVPLSELPDPEFVVVETDVPLGELPKTGVPAPTVLLIGIGFALVGIGIVMRGKNRKAS